MEKEQRLKEIRFIEKDTEERGEEIISSISFMARIYYLKVMRNGKKYAINYSSATTLLNGYRPINAYENTAP